jgi:hypothetical protein
MDSGTHRTVSAVSRAWIRFVVDGRRPCGLAIILPAWKKRPGRERCLARDREEGDFTQPSYFTVTFTLNAVCEHGYVPSVEQASVLVVLPD